MPALISTTGKPPWTDPAGAGLCPAGDGRTWIDRRFLSVLEEAGLDRFEALMGTVAGQCWRALPDRENWRLELAGPGGRTIAVHLKKHHVRTWLSRIRARLRLPPPPSAALVEARNTARLTAEGLPVMHLVAYGEKSHADGLVE